jgi:hypothetical protein
MKKQFVDIWDLFCDMLDSRVMARKGCEQFEQPYCYDYK